MASLGKEVTNEDAVSVRSKGSVISVSGVKLEKQPTLMEKLEKSQSLKRNVTLRTKEQ